MRLPAFALLLPALAVGQPTVIPLPAEMVLEPGTCGLECPWQLEYSAGVSQPFRELIGREMDALHPDRSVDCLLPFPIVLELIQPDTLLPNEWYHLRILPNGIRIEASDEEGLFRGSRTLIQLLEEGRTAGSIPCLSITDQPRFPWRGMHLDVCRHFFPVPFVKKYIDLLARYKMNTFHWHLTDDQGWRIEIRKHPELTDVGAWRSGSQVGPYSRREYDSTRYGGFYTQEQIRDVVAYAAARHITIVPEIEMPGHALAALASYPQLGCTGGPYEVQKGWGVFDDVFCAGNDEVFRVMEDVLEEVIALFPGTYIHIGGDECPKTRWKACAKCQARMKAEGLKDEHELQSYFIQRIEKFVNTKGRKIIGWDEILEGGLAPNAAVMSWRGTEGGIAAARQKHPVVMCPGSHCYFDHYQGDPANEPLAIGGYTTVQKVYGYEPIPDSLTDDEQRYIMGAQGNVWTEYILTPEHVEYMAVPRMLALAEVLWSPREKRDTADFMRRLMAEFPRLDAMKVNASRSVHQVRIRLKPLPEEPGAIEVLLQCDVPLDGITSWSDPPQVLTFSDFTYRVAADCRLFASPVKGGMTGDTSTMTLRFNKATARPITLSDEPNERYAEGGAFTLVDGVTAQQKRVSTEWLGWREGVTITVDLGSVQDIRYIGIGALNETHSWIHLPEHVDFSVSEDGKTFTPFGSPEVKAGVGRNAFTLDKAGKARFVRFTVKHRGKIPEGFPGAGNPAWMFLDEIDVH